MTEFVDVDHELEDEIDNIFELKTTKKETSTVAEDLDNLDNAVSHHGTVQRQEVFFYAELKTNYELLPVLPQNIQQDLERIFDENLSARQAYGAIVDYIDKNYATLKEIPVIDQILNLMRKEDHVRILAKHALLQPPEDIATRASLERLAGSGSLEQRRENLLQVIDSNRLQLLIIPTIKDFFAPQLEQEKIRNIINERLRERDIALTAISETSTFQMKHENLVSDIYHHYDQLQDIPEVATFIAPHLVEDLKVLVGDLQKFYAEEIKSHPQQQNLQGKKDNVDALHKALHDNRRSAPEKVAFAKQVINAIQPETWQEAKKTNPIKAFFRKPWGLSQAICKKA